MVSETPKPDFDSERAASMVRKTVLIGLTYKNDKGEITGQKQMYGKIIHSDVRGGLSVQLQGTQAGERYELPPDLRSFQPAQPGEYNLKSTGETVINPDFLCTWVVSRPPTT